jgi:hypothetical protein
MVHGSILFFIVIFKYIKEKMYTKLKIQVFSNENDSNSPWHITHCHSVGLAQLVHQLPISGHYVVAWLPRVFINQFECLLCCPLSSFFDFINICNIRTDLHLRPKRIPALTFALLMHGNFYCPSVQITVFKKKKKLIPVQASLYINK